MIRSVVRGSRHLSTWTFVTVYKRFRKLFFSTLNMNLVEADPREFFLSRFHRRVESYRVHHEQNYRLYQPIRREEVRKQLEETSQLHKKWIEFQAKRSVGKSKNEIPNSSTSAHSKKAKKRMPVSPETTGTLDSAYNQSSLNNYNKSSNVQCSQSFMASKFDQNCFSQSGLPNRQTLGSNAESELYHTALNNEGMAIYANADKSTSANSSLHVHYQDAKDTYDNSEKVDEEKEMENFLMGEEWDNFWDTLSRDGEMPNEVLQVLQDNENCDDLSGIAFNQSFLQDSVSTVDQSTAVAELPASSTIISFISTNTISNMPLSVAHNFNRPGSALSDQGVIKNNPHFINHSTFNSSQAAASTTSSSTGPSEKFDRLPSYDDVVSRRYTQPTHYNEWSSQFYGNGLNEETNKHHLNSHNQHFYHRTNAFCKENGYVGNNFLSYSYGNASDAYYHSFSGHKYSIDSSLYHDSFHACANDMRLTGTNFEGQSHSKLNSLSCEFFIPSQSLFVDGNASHLTGYQGADRNSYYWGFYDSSNITYQNHGRRDGSNKFPSHSSLSQQPNVSMSTKHPSDAHPNLMGTDGKACLESATMVHCTPNVSLDTELSMIEDIIGKK